MSTQLPGLHANVDHQRIWDLGYELLELIRTETSCDVWRIRHRKSYEIFIWKQLKAERETDPRARIELENEAAVGQLVRHPLFLRLIASHVTERPRYAVWEWFDGITLEQMMSEYVRLPISPALWMIRQCAQALDLLLQAGLTHGDLRAENILVDPRSGRVKVIGLGASRRLAQGSGIPSRRAVTPGPLSEYDNVAMTPYLRQDIKDLHQLGQILYRALAGRYPHDYEMPADLLRTPQTDLAEELRKVRPDVSEPLAELVRDLMSSHPGRPVRHPMTLVNRLMSFEIEELGKLESHSIR